MIGSSVNDHINGDGEAAVLLGDLVDEKLIGKVRRMVSDTEILADVAIR